MMPARTPRTLGRGARARRALSVAAASALVACAATAAHAQDSAPPKRIPRPHEGVEIPPLRPIAFPEPERIELESGAVIFLLPDHELPLIDMSVSFRGGSAADTRAKSGLAEIAGEVLRTGGTAKRPGDALDEALESIAASIEVSVGLTETQVGLSCLSQSFDEVLEALVDLLTAPSFPADKLELARKQALSGLARRNDDPAGIARREITRALFGDHTPFGWTDEPDTLRAITRDDLVAMHARTFVQRGAVAAVVGDFDPAAMKAKLIRALGALPAAGPEPVELPAIEEPAPRVLLVDRPELNQSTIAMGHLGVQRRADDADYFALVIGNAILGGGGFSSRLLQKVRTDMGLAYSVYSAMDAPYTHRGAFWMGCQTRCDATFEAMAAMRAELARLCAEEVTAEELAVAKESILHQLVFASESRSDIVSRAQRYEVHGFPQDYLERFQRGIEAVTAADVLRVCKARLDPARLVTVIVGSRALMGEAPAALGALEALDVDTPAYRAPDAALEGGAPAEAVDAAAGAALFAQMIDAMGGPEALARVSAVAVRGAGTFATPNGPLPVKVQTLMAYPDRVRTRFELPFGVVVQAYDGERGWVQTPMGVEDMPASNARQLREQVERDTIQMLRRMMETPPGLLPGREALEGGEAAVLLAADGTRVFVDLGTTRMVRKDVRTDEGLQTTLFASFRVVPLPGPLPPSAADAPPGSGGPKLVLPFEVKTLADGEEVVRLAIESIELNPEVPADAFARPEPAGQPEEGR